MSANNSDPKIESQSYREFDSDRISTAEAYRLLNHMVAPRPIAFVSTISIDGIPNLAPFSYFMAGGLNPPSIAFSPNTDRYGKSKDTLQNIQATGEFVVNVVSTEMLERLNITSIDFAPEISEWEEANFIPAPTVKVKPARVSTSLMAMECRLHQIVSHGTGANAANYVIGEVVYFHVAEHLIVNENIDPTQVEYVGRMGGNWYNRVSADTIFELVRPPQIDRS